MPTIDLNADLGESFGHWRMEGEAEVLPLVSSASIACGYHAGDPVTMRRSVRLAREHGVTVGAHPGYPDLVGFGRRDLAASPEEVTAMVIYQVGALGAICRAEGTAVRYVKPHGALYNRAAVDEATAAAVAEGVRLAGDGLALLALAGSALEGAGRAAGIPTAREAFADRAYRADGTLAPRSQAGSVLHDPEQVVAQALSLALDGRVATLEGDVLAIRPASLCVHGDNPQAPALLAAIRRAFADRGLAVAPFGLG